MKYSVGFISHSMVQTNLFCPLFLLTSKEIPILFQKHFSYFLNLKYTQIQLTASNENN